ncbi:hypothetical protein GCM10012279_33020 [Micromonospora yangpuensis]|nr:hypothetical protein GCM10012279_33020 [Micromonospora yangpuensis]
MGGVDQPVLSDLYRGVRLGGPLRAIAANLLFEYVHGQGVDLPLVECFFAPTTARDTLGRWPF